MRTKNLKFTFDKRQICSKRQCLNAPIIKITSHPWGYVHAEEDEEEDDDDDSVSKRASATTSIALSADRLLLDSIVSKIEKVLGAHNLLCARRAQANCRKIQHLAVVARACARRNADRYIFKL